MAAARCVVCALDTELLGHWWYEGIDWLRAVVQECGAQGLELLPLDEALAQTRARRHELRRGRAGPARHEQWAPSSWGRGGGLCDVVGAAGRGHGVRGARAELRLLRARERAGAGAVRELLALQSSDWAFLVSEALAPPLRA